MSPVYTKARHSGTSYLKECPGKRLFIWHHSEGRSELLHHHLKLTDRSILNSKTKPRYFGCAKNMGKVFGSDPSPPEYSSFELAPKKPQYEHNTASGELFQVKQVIFHGYPLPPPKGSVPFKSALELVKDLVSVLKNTHTIGLFIVLVSPCIGK